FSTKAKSRIRAMLSVVILLLLTNLSAVSQVWVNSNISTTINDGSGTYTQVTHHAWGNHHALFFNAYRTPSINGDLFATGNSKYVYSAGAYGNGAGAIMFLGNGGRMDFFVTEASPGANQNIAWGTPQMSIVRGGNVGIGTWAPSAKLHVTAASNNVAGFRLEAGAFSMGGSAPFRIDAVGIVGGRLTVAENGNVGIGSVNPNQKLTVNGTIYGREVKVDLNVPGPDYVFAKDYALMTLDQVRSYIEANGHLPEVPSAQEMETNGIHLSEMNMLLLKKVEELTLHIIQLNERIQQLEESKQPKK
ncbi:MAG: hypothetical protein ACK5SK_13495, partial [Cyclobacteriaceae bacterium]